MCEGLKLVNIWNSGTESCEKCGPQFGEYKFKHPNDVKFLDLSKVGGSKLVRNVCACIPEDWNIHVMDG
jgi:hypothetical protein